MKKRLTFLCLLACACSKGNFDPEYSGLHQESLSHGMIELGEQLDDPYSVGNMSKAFSEVYPSKGPVTLDPTDLYVRFLPVDDDQFNTLADMGIDLLDHPMDFRIAKEGDYYQDPEIGDDGITWQYSVVPIGFNFPAGIRYEVLDKVFIAENYNAGKAFPGVDWAAVEETAYRITGNGDMIEPSLKGGSAAPSGRIAILDSAFPGDTLGVEEVQVSCNSFVKFAHAYTDRDGYYRMSRNFSTNPRYRIVFRNRKGFGIGFNLILVPASFSTLGKASPEGLSVTLSKDSERKLWCRAVVNNACYDYFRSCEENGQKIKTPPSNLRIWLFQGLNMSSAVMLQQGAVVDNGIIGKFLGVWSSIVKMFLPDLTLGLRGQTEYRDIYATTIHECAHASHFAQVGTKFWDSYIEYVLTSWITSGFITYGIGTEKDHGYCEVGEMWAYYVQTRLFRERYPWDSTCFGTSYWFSPQIFLNLDDRGITRFRLFPALTEDINNKDILQDKLLSMYPEMKAVINQAFQKYL